MKISAVEKTGSFLVSMRRRVSRRAGGHLGKVTLDDGTTHIITDTSKGLPAEGAEVQDSYAMSGGIVLVLKDGNAITCREPRDDEYNVVLQPEWLTARLMSIMEHDKTKGYDENLEHLESPQPRRKPASFGIQNGQIWVRRIPTEETSIPGYPYLLRVSDTDYQWNNSAQMEILLPDVLRSHSFTIKPSLLVDEYELFSNPF